MNTDFQTFLVDLMSGKFSIAFDPLSKRYVKIKRVDNINNKIKIIAQRFSDAQIHNYGVFELIRFS